MFDAWNMKCNWLQIGVVQFSDDASTPPGDATISTCYHSELAFATPENRKYIMSYFNTMEVGFSEHSLNIVILKMVWDCKFWKIDWAKASFSFQAFGQTNYLAAIETAFDLVLNTEAPDNGQARRNVYVQFLGFNYRSHWNIIK